MTSLLIFTRLLAAAERLANADAESNTEPSADASWGQIATIDSDGPRSASNHERLRVFVHELHLQLQEVED
jgi:hypothetical protein